jgi:hypothetical protein
MNVKAPEWRLYTKKTSPETGRGVESRKLFHGCRAVAAPLLLSKVLPGPATGSRIVNRATPVASRSLGCMGGSKGGEGKALGRHLSAANQLPRVSCIADLG